MQEADAHEAKGLIGWSVGGGIRRNQSGVGKGLENKERTGDAGAREPVGYALTIAKRAIAKGRPDRLKGKAQPRRPPARPAAANRPRQLNP